VLVVLASVGPAFGAAITVPERVTSEDIAAERASLQPYERKLDTHVMRVLRAGYGRNSPNIRSSRLAVPIDDAGRAKVVIESANLSKIVDLLRRPDVTLSFADSNYGFAEAWVPLSLIHDLALMPEVRHISSGLRPRTRGITSSGDSILHADLARSDTGFDGTGVRIGVISDGDSTLGLSLASGELPTDTHVARDNTGGNEGTAMMEIVHDLAPGAGLYFASGNPIFNPVTGSAETTDGGTMIGAIRALEGSNCGVIVDDLGFYSQPMFQDGSIAQEAAFAVTQGFTYLSAAGNDRKKHYLGTYSDGGSYEGAAATVDHAHQFAPGELSDDFKLTGSGSAANPNYVNFILQWDDPWDAPVNNYDLYVFDNVTNTLIGSSVQVQGAGAAHPYESVAVQYGGAADTYVQLNVVVSLVSGAPARFHLYAVSTAAQAVTSYSPAGGIFGHPAANGVIAVAAVDANAPPWNTVEWFSDYGPTEIKYPAAVLRQEPSVAGIDDVRTSVSGFDPFYGTSAAAPHIAAIAALLKQAAPEMTPAQVQTALRTTATDIETSGIDYASGYGLVNADAALLWIRPNVTVDKTPINLYGYEGRFGATAAHFTLTNTVASRGGMMKWTATTDAPWLHVNRTSGRANASDEISVWADTNGLTAPGATAHVVITLEHCVQNSISIPVNLDLTAPGATITVDNNATTLAQAVDFANAHPGTTIKFAVPSSDPGYAGGVAKIAGPSVLSISAPGTFIDGFSQTLFGGDTNPNGPEVKISTTLYFSSSFNCVRGVDMANVPNTIGVNQVQPALWFEGPAANGNTVIGCYIGCDPTGQSAAPTQAGVEIDAGASGNRVGGTRAADRNIIAGCSNVGIQILSIPQYGVCQDNVIVGNWVGIDSNGTHSVGTQVTAIQLQSSCAHNAIGGSTPTSANVIGGTQYGIVLYATGATSNRIIGNLVGVDPTGKTAIPIVNWGISAILGATYNSIGGPGAGERNVISGNGNAGVVIESSGTYYNRVVGNLIGVAADGVTPIPNGGGVVIANGAAYNVVGGTTANPANANVISGNNGAGVWITASSTNNYVMGNAIGATALTGGVGLGNGGPGVYISSYSTGNVIGGMDPADGTAGDASNVIAFNGFDGVNMKAESSLTNVVSRNSIHDNSPLGIDLGDNGTADGDTSPYYRAPILNGAYLYSNFTIVSGTLHNGTDAATLQFYSNDNVDPSGTGQGQTYLLSVPLSTGGPFTVTIPGLPVGTHVAAIAIHTGGANPGDTSEFSNDVDVQATAPNTTPPNVLLLSPGSGTVAPRGTIQTIAWSADTGGTIQNQAVEYSLDSGATWNLIQNAIPADLRAWAWLVPDANTTHARVRVIAQDWNGQSGTGDSPDFTITSAPTLGDAAEALRIAGGLETATPSTMASLNVWTGGTSATSIDVLDAIRLARAASGT
jgi:hypothetical protein